MYDCEAERPQYMQLAAQTSETAKSKQKFSPRTGMRVIQEKPSCYFNVQKNQMCHVRH